MQSMTGFGQSIKSVPEADVTVEIRTVNSRFLDLHLRLPRELSWMEPQIRKEVQSRLKRGRVDFFLELTLKESDRHELNEPLVQNYLAVARQARGLGVKGELEVAALLQLPGVMIPRSQDYSPDGLPQLILEALGQSLEKVIASRAREGSALREDLLRRLDTLAKLTAEISQEAGKTGSYYRTKLEQRIQQLTVADEIDQNRLAQEILYHVERSDIAEEITRLESHMAGFAETLNTRGEEPQGKRLDFIAQEMAREMNTILSKSAITGLSRLAVAGKTEIERIREQVQNVE